MVSYVQWETLYLGLATGLRARRIVLPLIPLVMLAIAWSPVPAAGAALVFAGLVLLEGLLFGRRVRKTLTETPEKDSRRTAEPGS